MTRRAARETVQRARVRKPSVSRAREPERLTPNADILGLQQSIGNRAMETALRATMDDAAATIETPQGSDAELPRGTGQPLTLDVRERMETQFGESFDQVRVHSDSQAAAVAAREQARAFALGSDIVFADGQYQPRTSGGLRLLAHELAHVVQQRRGLASGLTRPPGAAAEHDANRAARAVAAGTAPSIAAATALGVARQAQDVPFPKHPVFIAAHPGLRKNWEAAATDVLRNEFPREKFASFEEAETYFKQYLKEELKSDAERQTFADRMRDRVRKAFWRKEAKNPSFKYSKQQKSKMSEHGAAPRKGMELEHLEEVKAKNRRKGAKHIKEIEGHPERALDPGNIYTTTKSRHRSKWKRYERGIDRSRRVRAKNRQLQQDRSRSRGKDADSPGSASKGRSRGNVARKGPTKPNVEALKKRIRSRARQRGFVQLPFGGGRNKTPSPRARSTASRARGTGRSPTMRPRGGATSAVAVTAGAMALDAFGDYLNQKYITEPHIQKGFAKLQPEIQRRIAAFDGSVLAERQLSNRRSYAVIRYSLTKMMSPVTNEDLTPRTQLESVGFSEDPKFDDEGEDSVTYEGITSWHKTTYMYSVEVEPSPGDLDAFVVQRANMLAQQTPTGSRLPSVRTKRLESHIRGRIAEIDKMLESDPTSEALKEEREAWAALLADIEPHLKHETKIEEDIERMERQRRISAWKKKVVAAKHAPKTTRRPGPPALDAESFTPEKPKPFTVLQRPTAPIEAAAEAVANLETWGWHLVNYGNELKARDDVSNLKDARRQFVRDVKLWFSQTKFWEGACRKESRGEAADAIVKLSQHSIGPTLTQMRTELDV